MNKKDIHRLATRFMDGKTSIEEQRRMAEYLRSHPNETGLENITAMFALFDTGMPIEGVTDVRPKTRAQGSILRHHGWRTSAAAVAILVVTAVCGIRFLSPNSEQPAPAPLTHEVNTGQCEHRADTPPLEVHADNITTTTTSSPIATMAQPAARKTTKRTTVRTKSTMQPIPETLPDSVVEATLHRQEMEAQQKYERTMLATEQAEQLLNRRNADAEALAEYLASREYVEVIEVW